MSAVTIVGATQGTLPARYMVRSIGGFEYEGWTAEMIAQAKRDGLTMTIVRETPLTYHCEDSPCGMCDRYNAEARRLETSR